MANINFFRDFIWGTDIFEKKKKKKNFLVIPLLNLNLVDQMKISRNYFNWIFNWIILSHKIADVMSVARVIFSGHFHIYSFCISFLFFKPWEQRWINHSNLPVATWSSVYQSRDPAQVLVGSVLIQVIKRIRSGSHWRAAELGAFRLTVVLLF